MFGYKIALMHRSTTVKITYHAISFSSYPFPTFVRIYKYEIPKPLRLLYVYIRTRTLRSKYGASNRHFTVSPHRPHEVFTCFRSAAGSHFTACLPTEEKWSLLGVYSELSAVFGKFGKFTIVGPSSIHRLVWNTTAHYMDFLP